ncbi:hypothetical protein LXL04_027966 [Taraxacum kok-saghyz]
MAKKRSMTRKQNHNDDASSSSSSSSSSSRKRIKSFDTTNVAPWSDVDHDVLYLVMMQLGFVDFFAFSGVCKSWRSVALSNKNTFMASKPPISICIRDPSEDEWCHLEDFQGTKFKTIIPHLSGRICVGSTCGYLILFGRETRDFWLVNPVTRHQLHFPDYSIYVTDAKRMRVTNRMSGVLVFSPSISGWVFILLYKTLSFCIAGKRGWNHVSSAIPIADLHVFKGKMYIVRKDCSLCELTLNQNQKRKWTLLETKNSPNPYLFKPRLVSSSENLYVMTGPEVWPKKVLELDFGEMKWVSPDKKLQEYALFVSYLNPTAAIKRESLAGPREQLKGSEYFLDDEKSRKCMFYHQWVWYFPHDCLNVNLLDQ